MRRMNPLLLARHKICPLVLAAVQQQVQNPQKAGLRGPRDGQGVPYNATPALPRGPTFQDSRILVITRHPDDFVRAP